MKPVWNNKTKNMPLFYINTSAKTRKSTQKNLSLTIFVHGYQGNSFDFQKAKNYLKKNNRSSHVLIV